MSLKTPENGNTPDEAERRAVRLGLVEERLVLGKLASGMTAISDMEASRAGIVFSRDLCGAEDLILAFERGRMVHHPAGRFA